MPTAEASSAAVAVAMLVVYLSPSSYAQGCGGTITNATAKISSPNYPNEYNSGMTCRWVVRTPLGEKVMLHIDFFSLGGDSDKLIFFYGAPVTCETHFIVYTKNDDPVGTSPLLGEEATVTFTSGDDGRGAGFQLSVEFLSLPTNTGINDPDTANAVTTPPQFNDCGRSLQDSGRLTSPNYPDEYPPNAHCVWYLLPRAGRPITLHIISLQLEPQYDTLRVYRSANPAPYEQPIAEYTGSVFGDTRSFTGSPAVTVVFTSDRSTQLNGFEAVFYSNASSPAPIPVPLSSLPVPGVCGIPAITRDAGSPDKDDRIVGGVAATPGAWPWQVFLKANGDFTCGGSLIAAQWVITAAHCIDSSSPKSYTVVLGKYRARATDVTQKAFTPSKIIVHPSYDVFPHDSDIALMKLGKPVTFNKAIRPICLPVTDVPPGTKCFATGWGNTKGTGTDSVLRQVSLPILSFPCCKKLLADSISKNMTCAGYIEGGKDTCQGDSGGPLVCKVDGYFYLYGATSYGDRCAEPFHPGVYTRITGFLSWIRKTIATN